MTNERPTPETDAVAMQPVDRLARAYTFHGTEPFKYSTNELVPAEFARVLERELAEAREELNNIRLNLGEDAEGYTLLHAVAALQNERDELHYKLQDAKQSLEVALQELSSTNK